jgi:hypothetical protein
MKWKFIAAKIFGKNNNKFLFTYILANSTGAKVLRCI